MKSAVAAAILAVAGTPAFAHRLDEYLQGAILSVEKNRLEAQMTLTPGVAVFPILIAAIDIDADGAISETEQHAYALTVLRDLSITIDGHRVIPRLLSERFPAVDEMREGRGEIQLDFDADLPGGGANRKLILENHHQSRLSAYQVNCLVPRDPGIRILAQNRNYSQSFYELDFAEEGGPSSSLAPVWLQGMGKPLGTITLLLFVWVAFLLGRRAHPARNLGPKSST
jgi:hypothetical protein